MEEKNQNKISGYKGYRSLAEAAKERGVSQDYLRFLIFKKKLQGQKMGRNWVTTNEWLDACLRANGHTTFKQKNKSLVKKFLLKMLIYFLPANLLHNPLVKNGLISEVSR